ncbi:tyrosine-type recombinase/integrase [Aeromicrobium ginsengisoli]|uniref:Tyrosine-type recombinase/integrase n=1 Tax=Aeromicrobium ginsengisoli TaxID=363867 RepID=A0A5M4FIS9_9ACTN|nr:tyrosine-type recombinase/integrase [Aeromicrobium ginsengisoli]KAA1399663.1 tyrosine-type recombinase/integrase [Aeromicrobium ginsengisoli]
MTDAEDDIADRLHRARIASFLAPDEEPSTPLEEPGLDALLKRTAAIYSQAITDETRADYARRWRKVEAWCTARGFESIPMRPEVLLLYLTAQIDSEAGISLATARGYASAVSRVHREAGVPTPTSSPLAYQFMRGLARHSEARPMKPTNTSAMRIGELRRVCRHLDSLTIDPRAARDAAILTLHGLGLGDGQLSRLTWPDLTVDDESMDIRLVSPRGGPDTTLTFDTSTESGTVALNTLLTWRAIATEALPPVFSPIEPSGWRSPEPLTKRAVFLARHSRLSSLGANGQLATIPDAIALLSGTPSEVLRDRALLLIGFAMAARRGEVTRLVWSDIVERTGGLEVHIRSSKTDMSGRGVTLGIPHGKSSLTDPVAALAAWRARVAQQLGESAVQAERKVFVHVGRSGKLTETPLSPEGLTRLVARRAQEANCVGSFGGRSLRSGFISTAADSGIPVEAIARQSRHRRLESLVLYIRQIDPIQGSAAGEIGL